MRDASCASAPNQYSGGMARVLGPLVQEQGTVAFDSSDQLPLDGRWPLVGRKAVVDCALAALRSAVRIVALHGESGVGRSRAAEEVVSALEDDGWLCVTVEGNPALSSVPLTTIAPVLTGGMSPSIAEADDEEALFAAASAVLGEIGGERRVLLVLDDAAAADPVSLALIGRLVAAELLRVLLTLDRADPVPQATLLVVEAADALSITVGELAEDETEELVTLVLGGPIEDRAVDELHRASSGNPMFLRELVIRADASGLLLRERNRWRLAEDAIGSPSLPELIRARLSGLTHEEQDVVERLSLCQPLALDEFARPGAPEAIADLEQRGLVRVRETGDRMHMLLAHPEYAAAVRARITRARQATLLAQQADVVAHRRQAPADRLRVALWRLDARRPSDPDLLLRSARLAQGVRDHRHAERLVCAALSSGADASADHLLHAQLLKALSRPAEALSALDRAQDRVTDAAGRAAIDAQRAQILAGA